MMARNSTTGRIMNQADIHRKGGSGMSYLDRLNELMELGWDEDSASKETYSEFFPDRYNPDDYDQ